MALRHKTVTLTGSVQRLSDVIGLPDAPIVSISMIADDSNTNPVYLGSTSTISSSDYGVILANPNGTTKTPTLHQAGPWPSPSVRMSDIYVLGTNNEKLHVMWVPYI